MAVNVLEKVKEKIFTIEEYYDLEEKSHRKNEFRNGKITPMPNTTINHNEISGNIFGQLYILSLQNNTFRVFNPEQKIYIEAYNQMLYPDGCAVLGEIQKFDKYAIKNPIVVFEVASPLTINYDRNDKFRKYKSLPSFQEYVLINQNMPSVEVFSKTELGWVYDFYLGLEEIVKLKSIDCEIKMSEIYRNVENLEAPQGQIEFEEK
jgi:Uma2 family endonuclease